MTGVDAVLFDLDGTICEYERSATEIIEACFEQVGVAPFFDEREYLERFFAFEHDGEGVREIRAACFADLADEAGYDPAVGTALADAYAERRDHRNVRFTPGAERALEAVAAEYPLGLVTNGDAWMQSQKLEALDIAHHFQRVVHAGYDAPAKPEPDPFHLALDALDVAPDRAVHVGNSLVSDVPGAKAAGLQAAWLDDGSDHGGEPDYVLDSLAALTDPPWAST